MQIAPGNKKKHQRSHPLKKMRSTAMRVLRYVSEFEIDIVAPLAKVMEQFSAVFSIEVQKTD